MPKKKKTKNEFGKMTKAESRIIPVQREIEKGKSYDEWSPARKVRHERREREIQKMIKKEQRSAKLNRFIGKLGSLFN